MPFPYDKNLWGDNVSNLTNVCTICKTEESPSWWKCCSEHTSEKGVDVVCQACANKCFSNQEMSLNKEPIIKTNTSNKTIKITNCSLNTIPGFHCVICHKLIHRGDSGCICSTFRQEFEFVGLCVSCAGSYDRLMSTEEFQPILKHLLNKSFWEGVVRLSIFKEQ